VIVGGVLGLGTALVFGLAAVTAAAFPSGTVVATQLNGWARDDVGIGPGWVKVGGPVGGPVAPQPFVQTGPAVNLPGGIMTLPAPTPGN
jgi:hypothetical protein